VNTHNTKAPLGNIEFVMLMAFITSLTALSIDSILPALAIIAHDFNLSDTKQTQQIIVTLFLGMAFGQFFYGPLADSIGRKPTIYIGIGLFLIGSLFAIFAQDLNTMLIGRLIQGIGVASPRIVAMAIVRDSFSGNHMARIMSLMMTIFVIIPIIAPTLGFWILTLSHWRMIYIFTAVFSLTVLIWFALRQAETLKAEHQHAFNFANIYNNCLIIFKDKSVMGYTVISGLVFGVFLGYLSASQHLFQNIYDTGDHFPYYFASLAASLGFASLLNAKWVLKFGSKKIVLFALFAIMMLSSGTLLFIYFKSAALSLTQGMAYLTLLFFLIGLLFGNLNALAMHPIGHLAGIGAGVIGSISTFISIPLGHYVGQAIETNLNSFILAFLICSVISIAIQQAIETTQLNPIKPA